MTDSEKSALEDGAAEGTPTPPGAETTQAPDPDSAAVTETPKSESPEERPKAPEYEIVPSKRDMPETGFVADPVALAAVLEAANGTAQKGSGKSRAGKGNQPLDLIQKFTASQTKVYAAVGIGMGLLAGLIVAALFLHPNSHTAPIDMGPATANQYGLKGHLTTAWKDRLEYQVTIEPVDSKRAAAFAANVNASPKPLSIEVQVKDPFGAVLCGNTILLRFDPRNTPGITVPEPGPKATKAEKALATRNQIAQGLRLAKLEGQELDREHGKDVFRNNAGKDGQLESIGAEGVLPCTRQQFEKVASWGFTSNFPVVTPPAESAPASPFAQDIAEAEARSAKEAAAEKAAAKARAKRRPALPAPPIYIEGDDAIMRIDEANRVLETRNGKALHVDKSDSIVEMLKERDFPIPIHYRCDQEGNCTFGVVGTGVHHARLRR